MRLPTFTQTINSTAATAPKSSQSAEPARRVTCCCNGMRTVFVEVTPADIRFLPTGCVPSALPVRVARASAGRLGRVQQPAPAVGLGGGEPTRAWHHAPARHGHLAGASYFRTFSAIQVGVSTRSPALSGYGSGFLSSLSRSASRNASPVTCDDSPAGSLGMDAIRALV